MTQHFLLLQVGPCTERAFKDRNGQQQQFAERVFKLTDGINTFNAFATGDRARTTPLVGQGDVVTADLSFAAREWEGQDGAAHYETVCYINRIGTLWKK